MKAWLKGGLIGAGIGILFGILTLILSWIDMGIGKLIIRLCLILSAPWNYILYYTISFFNEPVGDLGDMLLLVLCSIIGIIVNGFIIGAIISKIISSKSNKRYNKK